MTRCPNRAVLRIHKVRAAARVRRLAHVHQRHQLVFLGIDHSNLVRGVGSHHEITTGRIEAAIVQEAGRINGGGLQIVQIRIVHHVDLAGFLRVHHELRMVMRGHNRSHARFRVVFLRIHRHATGRNDLQRLQGRTIHNHILRRPVRAGHGIFVFIALVLRGFHRAGFQTDTDLSHGIRLGHPQVDQVNLTVTANHVQVTARCRNTRDMHRIASRQNCNDFLGIAVDQRYFAAIT